MQSIPINNHLEASKRHLTYRHHPMATSIHRHHPWKPLRHYIKLGAYNSHSQSMLASKHRFKLPLTRSQCTMRRLVTPMHILSLYDIARYECSLRVWSLAKQKKPSVLVSTPPTSKVLIKLFSFLSFYPILSLS